MSGLPPLDIRSAQWDRMRDAVVIAAGRDHVVVTKDALESHVNRSLTAEEAIEAAEDEHALLRAVANATASQDGVITITRGILSNRDWSVTIHDADGEAAEIQLGENAGY